ncbi:hypothetical protein [Corynebacterium renale]|uniref:hypothetical protein n=1 Tax=Corynebacterium renale TaxID=1724 RepID=UPI000DFD704B|nr:hypothetical protein [Corynebacterium renale]STD70318.1 Uncharacterised protein [Corynebacterium renale]
MEIWLISTLTGLPELKEILELQNDPDVQALGGLHPELQAALDKLGDKVVQKVKDRLRTDKLPELTIDSEAVAKEIGLNKVFRRCFLEAVAGQAGHGRPGPGLGQGVPD